MNQENATQSPPKAGGASSAGAGTSDPVLTDDEKNALLDGVSSGAVEVHGSGGPQYASVRPYEVDARARMVTDSYPRLQALDQRFAEHLAAAVEGLLQCEAGISATGLEVRAWRECRAQLTQPAMRFLVNVPPLTGSALVVLSPELVGHLVEAFFGSELGTGYNGAGAFTPGERSVATRFCDTVLASLRDVWRPLIELSPERAATDVPLDLVDLVRDAEPVVVSGFEITLAAHHAPFHVLWPRDTIAPLLPAFEGAARERDAAADARWATSIRQRLAAAPIAITTCIGTASHRVGTLTELAAGDVLNIADPRAAIVFAGDVPVIEGRFGVLEGRNAVEATAWLDRADHSPKTLEESKHGE